MNPFIQFIPDVIKLLISSIKSIIHWYQLESNEIKFTIKRHRFFIITGDRKACLDAHLSNHPELLTDKYWEGFKLNRVEDELIRLFNIAVNEKVRLSNDEFSDNYDIEFI